MWVPCLSKNLMLSILLRNLKYWLKLKRGEKLKSFKQIVEVNLSQMNLKNIIITMDKEIVDIPFHSPASCRSGHRESHYYKSSDFWVLMSINFQNFDQNIEYNIKH